MWLVMVAGSSSISGLGRRPINHGDPSRLRDDRPPQDARSISSTTAAASAWSAAATVIGKMRGRGDDLAHEKTHTEETSTSSNPTMAAADCGVSPPVNQRTESAGAARDIPGPKIGEGKRGGGVQFGLEFFDHKRAEIFYQPVQ